MKIGCFDSGIGGLNICKDLLYSNGIDVLYYADKKNLPYGNKSANELISLIAEILTLFKKENVDILLIACNTASLTLHNNLQYCVNLLNSNLDNRHHDGDIIGVCPCFEKIKPNEKTLCWCTELSSKSDYVKKCKNEYNAIILPDKNLASIIEDIFSKKIEIPTNELFKLTLSHYSENIICQSDIDFLKFYIKKTIGHYMPMNNLILGCTHYIYIKDIVKELYPSVMIYDCEYFLLSE